MGFNPVDKIKEGVKQRTIWPRTEEENVLPPTLLPGDPPLVLEVLRNSREGC